MVRLGSMIGTFYFSKFGEFLFRSSKARKLRCGHLLVVPAKRLNEPGVEHRQNHG